MSLPSLLAAFSLYLHSPEFHAFPCRWLVALLNQRGSAFCMRAEKSGNAGFARVRDFLRSGQQEAIVTLAAPDRRDATDYECPALPQTVRLVRHVASTGKVRVLMTNLLDMVRFPAAEFGDLYHQRWAIEEAFKRLKHRLNLEHVSGLSQQALLQDFHAKILCDNLQALVTHTATDFRGCASGEYWDRKIRVPGQEGDENSLKYYPRFRQNPLCRRRNLPKA